MNFLCILIESCNEYFVLIFRQYFTPTNLFPLWTESFDMKRRDDQIRSSLKYLQNQKLDSYPGGVPTTKYHTGQQWDFPNCWPPIEHFLVQG